MKVIHKRIIAVLLILTIMIPMFSTITYASFLGGVAGESSHSPSPPPSSGGGGGSSSSGSSSSSTPSDAPNSGEPEDSSGSGDKTITIEYHTTIKGNVYEDLGYASIGQQGSDSTKAKLPIEGVLVRLKQGDTIVDQTRTNASGNYEFKPAPGTYTTEFVYGDINGIDPNDVEMMKKVLKYNGHDYIAVEAPEKEVVTDMTVEEVIQSGQGALQFYIALDCSVSMRDTKVMFLGKERSRLDVAVESAKDLCKNLLDSGDNIYIGLIFFSGENYRAVSLTKSLTLLNQALDDINREDGWCTSNTNVLGALDKAYESFYNNDKENSNRFITIISDGVPTSDGSTVTYSDDSEETLYSKLDQIAETTKNKITELKEDGVHIFSLITKSQDQEEADYVNRVFSESDRFETIEDGNQTSQAIREELKEYLITNKKEEEYTYGHEIILGYEETERREEVDSQFVNELTYDNTIMFDQIDNYTPQSYDTAKELSDKTYMIVKGREEAYKIESGGTNYSYTETDSEGNEITVHVEYVEVHYENQNLGLARRPGFALKTKVTTTGLRVILQNGQVLNIQTLEPGSEGMILQTLDDELTFGTTLQVEYTITIKNDSSLQCNYLELMTHLPQQFIYDSNTDLITEDGQNSKYNWEIVNLKELKNNNLISQGTLDKYTTDEGDNIKNISLKTVLDNNNQGENGFYIAPGGEYQVKFVLTRLIANLDDFYSTESNGGPVNEAFLVDAEVFKYKDSGNRRMVYPDNDHAQTETIDISDTEQIQAEITPYLSAYPGDSNGEDFTENLTNTITIIPPTGTEQKENTNPVILISNLILGYVIGRISI